MEEGLHHILNDTFPEPSEEEIIDAYENPDPESLELAEAAAAAFAAAFSAHSSAPAGAEFAPPDVRAALNALTYNPLL